LIEVTPDGIHRRWSIAKQPMDAQLWSAQALPDGTITVATSDSSGLLLRLLRNQADQAVDEQLLDSRRSVTRMRTAVGDGGALIVVVEETGRSLAAYVEGKRIPLTTAQDTAWFPSVAPAPGGFAVVWLDPKLRQLRGLSYIHGRAGIVAASLARIDAQPEYQPFIGVAPAGDELLVIWEERTGVAIRRVPSDLSAFAYVVQVSEAVCRALNSFSQPEVKSAVK
jgi:hypothetical protein